MFSYKYLLCLCFCTLIIPTQCVLEEFIHSIFDMSGLSPNYAENINMLLFKGSTESLSVYHKIKLSEITSLTKHLDLNLPFVLYVHGFLEHYSNESIQTVIEAYLNKGGSNIVALDWSAYSYENYRTLAKHMKAISFHTAKALEHLIQSGVKLETMHIVGHSLGCQLAGFLYEFVNFTLPRITALDPANPLYYSHSVDHINGSSARQVDVIHTDRGVLGAFPDTGTIDFYPNGGMPPQPGCKGVEIDICSHQRSWRFYAESIMIEDAFPALQCSSYQKFLNQQCKTNRINYFGYANRDNTPGKYFFQTNKQFPFGMKMSGIYK